MGTAKLRPSRESRGAGRPSHTKASSYASSNAKTVFFLYYDCATFMGIKCRTLSESNSTEDLKSMNRGVIAFTLGAVALLALTATLGIDGIGAERAIAQEPPGGFEKLARALTAQLQNAHVKKVAIFNLATVDGKQIPFGSWLADRISEALAKSGAPIEVVDRARLSQLPNGDSMEREGKSQLRSDTARLVGADAFVDGSFGGLTEGIGITLDAQHIGGESIRISQRQPLAALGKIPLDDDVKSHLGVPIESLRPADGVYKPGAGGVGVPECVRCPQPDFSGPGVQRNTNGRIAMSVIISTEGKVLQLDVTKKVGKGFDEQAAKVVRTWQFKPALDAEGNAVVIRQDVEVTYKFY